MAHAQPAIMTLVPHLGASAKIAAPDSDIDDPALHFTVGQQDPRAGIARHDAFVAPDLRAGRVQDLAIGEAR